MNLVGAIVLGTTTALVFTLVAIGLVWAAIQDGLDQRAHETHATSPAPAGARRPPGR